MRKTFHVITMLVIHTLNNSASAQADEPLLPAGKQQLQSRVDSSQEARLIRQTRKLLEQELGPIQVVGRELTQAEKDRVAKLSSAVADLRSAENVLRKEVVDQKRLVTIRKTLLAPQPKRTSRQEADRLAIPAVRLIRQVVKTIENQGNRLKIVGRTLAPAEMQRLNLLADATAFLQHAEEQVVAAQDKQVVPSLKRLR